MLWIRRIAVSLPLAIAGVLNVLVVFADRLHLRLERIAGYGFLFATPWAWLLDFQFPQVHSRWLESFMPYVFVLWIPALLYSLALWLLVRVLGIWLKGPSRERNAV